MDLGKVCRAAVSGVWLLALSFCSTAATADPILEGAEPVRVTVRPIDHFEIGQQGEEFGPLTFLGGMELISADRNIGGLSGLISLENGAQMLAVTDNGIWFAAEINQDETGKPLGIEDPRYTWLLGTDGKTLRARWGHDTEALAFDGKEIFVTAERANRIYRYPWPLRNGRERMLEDLDLPSEIRNLRGTKGLEALAVAPTNTPLEGALVAIAERGKNESANLPAFLINGKKVQSFAITKSGRYDATDAAFLPDGDLLLLERRFNLRDLVGMRIRRFSGDSIQAGAVLSGDVLMEADYGFQIDNMEGLAIHTNETGRTILTLLSDNNRSLLQRTLLLRFELKNE